MKKLFLSLVLGLNLVTVMAPMPALAQADVVCDQIKQVNPDATCTKAASESAFNKVVRSILQVLSYLVGTIAVLVIVIAGIMYVVSAGNPDNAKKAKDAILYAVVGIVIALSAQAIVRFVLDRVE